MNLESIQDESKEEEQEELFHILVRGGVTKVSQSVMMAVPMNCDQSVE